MTLADVLAFLDMTDDLGLVPWLAGSWGDAAARGEAARDGDDLDLFMPATDAAVLAQHLAVRGFDANAEAAWHIVFVDRHGRTIDVRLFERDGAEITHGPEERLPAATLDGYGLVGTRAVRRLAG